MEIKEAIHDGYTTLSPVGELDANSSIEMDAMIWKLIDRAEYKIHIDLSELEYISSAGLGVFISFLQELKAGGGKFVFSGLSENIMQVFKLLGLHNVMEIVDTAEDAANAFKE